MEAVPVGMIPFLVGNLDVTTLPDIAPKSIRVYVACTDTDMEVERTALAHRVYPALREYCCTKYGLEYHMVDLRWGLQEELADNDPNRELYTLQVEECQRLSAGPNFVAFLGQRYGERPLPARIQSIEFNLLREALKRHKSRDTRHAPLLDFWYQADDNSVPPCYMLQPRDRIDKQHETLSLIFYRRDVCCRGKNMNAIERQLQLCLNRIHTWSVENGFKFSKSKTVCMHFCKLRAFHLDPDLTMDGDPIKRSVDGCKQTLTWDQTKASIRKLLASAAEYCVSDGNMTEHDAANFTISDLERETHDGVLRNIDPNNCCLLMTRTIVDLKNYINDKGAHRFIDLICQEQNDKVSVDGECESLLESLKNDKLKRWLPSEANSAYFQVLWKYDNGIDTVQHSEYIDDLCENFYEKMRNLIDRVAQTQSLATLPPLVEEVRTHWQVVREHSNCFVGRVDELKVVRNYVLGKDCRPFIITGPQGAGKTALMSRIAMEVGDWIDGDYVTVLRFIGATQSSLDIRQVLHSICTQLDYINDHPVTLPTGVKDLQTHFSQTLQSWPSSKSLIILLDSLHMLKTQYNVHSLGWLPQNVKENVKIIVSTLPEKHTIIDNLCPAMTCCQYRRELPELTPEESLLMIESLLDNEARCISTTQRMVVEQAFQTCGLPFYVKLICEEAVRWHHTDEVMLAALPRTVQGCVDHFFEQLEANHGKQLVSRAFAYMTASTTGLSDSELEDVLSLDDDVLNEVFKGREPGLRRIPPYCWCRLKHNVRHFIVQRQCEGFTVTSWSHRLLEDTAKSRYMSDDDVKKNIHSILADYFLGVWFGKPKPYHRQQDIDGDSKKETEMNSADRLVPAQHLAFTADDGIVTFNKRKYDQVPRHLFLAGRLAELNQCVLFSYEWIFNKTKALSLERVLADFVLNPGVEATLVERALRDAQQHIERDMDTMGVELCGRLLAYYHTHANIRQLVEETDRVGLTHCALIPNFPYHQVPGSPLKHVLTFPDNPTSLVVSGENSRTLLTKTATDPVVHISDLVTGEHVTDITTSTGDMLVTPNGRRLIIIDHVTEKAIKIHAADTGQYVGQLIPLNQVQMKPKEKYHMGALSVSDVHVAFIVTTDTSYLCIADVEACRFLEVQGLEGRADVCHLTPDGQYCFTNSNNFIRSYDLYTSDLVSDVELEYRPTQVLVTENGKRGYLVNGTENKVYVMYIRDGNIEFIYKVVVTEYFPADCVMGIALSRNQELLLAKGDDNLVVYNTVSERVVAHFPRPSDIPREFKLPKSNYADIHFTQADFSPDDKFIIASIFRHIYIWNIANNRLLTTLQAPVGIIDHLLIPSQRGQVVTKQRNRKEIHVWGLGDAIGHIGMSDSLTSPIDDMKLSASDHVAFVRCQDSDEIGVLDMRSGLLVDLLTHPSKVASFAITPNAKYVLVATEPMKANTANRIWYMDERKVIYEFGNVGAYSVGLANENCLIAIAQEERSFKAPYHIKLYTFEGEQFEECRLSYEVKFVLSAPFVTPGDKYLVILTADDYCDALALHENPTICAISLKANMAVSTFSVKDLRDSVQMERILHVKPYGKNSYTVMVFYTNEPDFSYDGTRTRSYIHCYGFIIFDVCSGVVCQVIEDLVSPSTALDALLFTSNASICLDRDSNMFDMRNGYFLKRLTDIGVPPRRVALDGQVALYIDGCHLVVINISDGRQKARVDVHAHIKCVEVCHDDRTILLGCEDGSIMSYVVVDCDKDDIHTVLATIPSRQNGMSSRTSSSKTPRSWDKIELETMIPPYSRPPSVVSGGPVDRHPLSRVKPVPRVRPTSETILYTTQRSKTCAVM